MSDDLAEKSCKPCEGGMPPLSAGQARKLLEALHNAWAITADGRAVERSFEFKNYSRTLGFANAVAWIAISEGHHPVLTVGYDRCKVSLQYARSRRSHR